MHCRIDEFFDLNQSANMNKRRLIIGISGATGVIYGVRLLQCLAQIKDIETHLILSKAAKITLDLETDFTAKDIQSLADYSYSYSDIAAAISSGSFLVDGMVILPCSIKTLSGIANSYDDNLLIRAADVCLKEKRKLVLAVRETPLHQGHLELMLKTTQFGATIMPIAPAFYHRPQTVNAIIDHFLMRVLDQFNIHLPSNDRWKENSHLNSN